MKKIYLLGIAFCLSHITTHAQNKNLLKEIDESIQEINKMLQLPDAIIISAGDDKDFDPDDAFAFEEKLKVGSDTDIQHFFDSLSLSQSLSYPYSAINIRNEEFDYLKLLGLESNYLMDHPDEEPVFRLKKIYFKNGSSIEAKDNYYEGGEVAKKYSVKKKDRDYEYEDVDTSKMSDIEREAYNSLSAFSKTFIIIDPKPVSKLDFDIDIFTKTQSTHRLDKNNNQVKTEWGNIVLNEIKGNSIQIDIPYAIKDNVTVQAVYKDGRTLDRKSYSCSSGISPKDKAYYNTFKEKLEKARELVLDKKINNADELEKWSADNMPIVPQQDKINQCNYSFSGPVSAVDVRINDTTLNKTTLHTQYSFDYYDAPEDRDYAVASDFATGKMGVIDMSGNWVIQPTYEDGFRKLNKYFFWDQLNDKDDLYWFDIPHKQLKKVNYKFKDGELYANRYMTTQSFTNGPMGVVDAITGEEKLPPINDYVWWRDGYWEVKKTDGVYGIYDTAMKSILPFEFSRIDKRGNYFFTEKKDPEKSYQNIEDIYNNKGENITQSRFQDIGYEFEGGYIIVETNERSKEDVAYVINSRYYIMDSTGKIVLTIPPDKYDVEDREGIHNGLFVVEDKKTNGKGFMNVKGQLAIPCKYGSVATTYPHTALVEEDGEQMIIDYSGNVIKKLPDHYQSSYFNEKTGLYQIHLYNGERYNERGEKVD